MFRVGIRGGTDPGNSQARKGRLVLVNGKTKYLDQVIVAEARLTVLAATKVCDTDKISAKSAIVAVAPVNVAKAATLSGAATVM